MFDLDIVDILIIIIAFLSAITIHECSHALTASILGDSTARRLGRISLNPLVHLDPLGTIMMLVTAVTGYGIGWGKPVPVNGGELRFGPKNGMAMVAFAGPLSNFLLATLLVLPVRAGMLTEFRSFVIFGETVYTGQILGPLISINIILGVFNLIPLPPLDGASVLLGFLPTKIAMSVARVQAWGPGVLMALLLADQVLHTRILSSILSPAISLVGQLLLGG